MNPQFIIIIKVAPTLFADVVIMIGRLVELGIEVAMDSEVVLVLEVPFAVDAVGVHVAIVFSELCVVVEILLIMRFRRFVLYGAMWRDEKRDRPLCITDRHGGPPLHEPIIHHHHQSRSHTFRRCGNRDWQVGGAWKSGGDGGCSRFGSSVCSRCSGCVCRDRVLGALRSRRNTAHKAVQCVSDDSFVRWWRDEKRD